jgi:hypothetical protein
VTVSPKTRDRLPWGLVSLLVLAMVVSFFDRGNLAVSAPVLAPQLGLSTWQVGVLLSDFLLSWLPSYLVRERHFTLNSVALWGALPYLFMAVSSMGGGILADRWISRGGVPVRVRRGFLVTGLLLTAAILPCVLPPRIEFAVAGLFVACLAFSSTPPTCFH